MGISLVLTDASVARVAGPLILDTTARRAHGNDEVVPVSVCALAESRCVILRHIDACYSPVECYCSQVRYADERDLDQGELTRNIISLTVGWVAVGRAQVLPPYVKLALR